MKSTNAAKLEAQAVRTNIKKYRMARCDRKILVDSANYPAVVVFEKRKSGWDLLGFAHASAYTNWSAWDLYNKGECVVIYLSPRNKNIQWGLDNIPKEYLDNLRVQMYGNDSVSLKECLQSLLR